jgi:hypothetical protein
VAHATGFASVISVWVVKVIGVITHEDRATGKLNLFALIQATYEARGITWQT